MARRMRETLPDERRGRWTGGRRAVNSHPLSRGRGESFLAVALRQIIPRLHLDEARDGALELESAVAGRIEGGGLGVGGGEELDLVLVELVDEGDEAGGFVALLRAHDRDADDDHAVVA